MRVGIYTRVSTTEQVQEGFSIAAQKEKLISFCKSQDWTIIDEFIEEGVSAKDTNRPELTRLLETVKKKEIDIVLVYKLDRLTRSILDLYSLLQTFDQYDVKFRSATEVYDTSTAIGRLFITLVAALAQWERENLSERVAMGMEQLVLSGHRAGGKLPFGYMKDTNSNEKNEMLIPHPVEKEIVREIFDLYIKGKGVRTICSLLNKQGKLTSNGSEWAGRHLVYVLTNPLYIGQLRWGKNRENTIVSVGKHEAIIDIETWERAQAEYKRREEIAPRFATGIFPFSGLLLCGHCGKPMTVKNGNKTYPHKLYLCSNKECSQIQIRLDVLEELFLEHLLLIAESDWKVDATDVSEEEKQLYEVKNKIKDIDRKKKRWFDAYENDLMSIKELKEKTLDLAAEKMHLEKKEQELIEKIQQSRFVPSADLLNKIVKIDELWDVYSEEERKQLLNMFFSKIELHLLPEFLKVERVGKSFKGLRKRIKHYLKLYPKI